MSSAGSTGAPGTVGVDAALAPTTAKTPAAKPATSAQSATSAAESVPSAAESAASAAESAPVLACPLVLLRGARDRVLGPSEQPAKKYIGEGDDDELEEADATTEASAQADPAAGELNGGTRVVKETAGTTAAQTASKRAGQPGEEVRDGVPKGSCQGQVRECPLEIKCSSF